MVCAYGPGGNGLCAVPLAPAERPLCRSARPRGTASVPFRSPPRNGTEAVPYRSTRANHVVHPLSVVREVDQEKPAAKQYHDKPDAEGDEAADHAAVRLA